MLVSKSLLCIKLRSTTLLFVRPKRLWLLLIIHHSLNYSFHLFYGLWFSCFQQTLSWARHLPSCPQQQKEAQLWKTCPMPIPSSRSLPGQWPSLLVPVWGFYVCVFYMMMEWVCGFMSCRMCAECYIEVKYNVFLFKRSYIQYATV